MLAQGAPLAARLNRLVLELSAGAIGAGGKGGLFGGKGGAGGSGFNAGTGFAGAESDTRKLSAQMSRAQEESVFRESRMLFLLNTAFTFIFIPFFLIIL